ncbi:sugar kinase [Rhizobacter sp. AJA081-3]|uniref:sugar kinase n=1 Tax=Rhizobacter sp. AJA081-3 TaxID=2753607 RepID=UPI001ADF374B|nr:sugar kinase [Rhizobacter sp. AJA081-3]QTN22858.1 sugar kinase [Rhizobacter sp. AJA081-3]
MTTPPLDVITLGETMVSFAAHEAGPLDAAATFTKIVAGAESNVGVGLARLGLKVAWVSRLGDDSFGRYIRRALEAEGIDCTAVATDPTRPTGFMLKSRALEGQDPVVEYFRRGSAASALSVADFDEARFLSARHLHVTGITPALSPSCAELVEHAMAAMRAAGRTVSFDPNLRPKLWPSREAMAAHLNRLAGLADWVLPGIAEGRTLTGLDTPEDIAAFYLDRGARAVLIKLGAEGAYWRTREGAGRVPGVQVTNIVDTVGAGDAFAAGALSGRLEGLDWPQALARANWVGAQVIQVVGDMDGLPRRDRLPAALRG